MILLNQVFSLKYLGLSLEEIKERISNTSASPEDITNILSTQYALIADEISKLQNVLNNITILQDELKNMQNPDLDSFTNITLLLQKKSSSYWLIKVLHNSSFFSHVKKFFSGNLEHWEALYTRWNKACDDTLALQKLKIENTNENQESDEYKVAADWWQITLDFLDRDLSLLGEVSKIEEDFTRWDETMKSKVLSIQKYRNQILINYLERENIEIP